jgi:SPP1 family predicted phage head-tail adaptor
MPARSRSHAQAFVQAQAEGSAQVMIQAGQLRQVITIQRPVATQDGTGQESAQFEDLYADIRAEVSPLSGNEYVAARQVNAEVTTRMMIRRLPDVDARCRVVRTITCDDPPTVEVYDILAVLPDLKSGLHYLTLMCVQRFADGWRRGA